MQNCNCSPMAMMHRNQPLKEAFASGTLIFITSRRHLHHSLVGSHEME